MAQIKRFSHPKQIFCELQLHDKRNFAPTEAIDSQKRAKIWKKNEANQEK
jgi:hypothetical protein